MATDGGGGGAEEKGDTGGQSFFRPFSSIWDCQRDCTVRVVASVTHCGAPSTPPRPIFQENPGFDFQPDSSAPVLDPSEEWACLLTCACTSDGSLDRFHRVLPLPPPPALTNILIFLFRIAVLAGNATAVFLSAGNTSCADWWPEVVDFLFMRVEQNKFLSSAVPGCGHHIGNSAELATPTGSSAATLGKMTTQFEALSVVVTPLVVAPDTAVARELVRSASATAGLVTALTQDAAAHGYDGYVLDFNLAGFGTPDETALAALAAKLANALGAGRSLGLVVPGARASTALAEGLAGSGVIVHMSQTRSAYQFAEFDAAVEAATVQFAGHPLSIGLSLSAADWWGGTERYNDCDIILALISSHASTGAVTTVPDQEVFITLLDVSC